MTGAYNQRFGIQWNDDRSKYNVGSHKLLVGQGWTSYQPRSLLMTNGLSSMGYSLPAAITAQPCFFATPRKAAAASPLRNSTGTRPDSPTTGITFR